MDEKSGKCGNGNNILRANELKMVHESIAITTSGYTGRKIQATIYIKLRKRIANM